MCFEGNCWFFLGLLILLEVVEGVGIAEGIIGFLVRGLQGGEIIKVELAFDIVLKAVQVVETSGWAITDHVRGAQRKISSHARV